MHILSAIFDLLTETTSPLQRLIPYELVQFTVSLLENGDQDIWEQICGNGLVMLKTERRITHLFKTGKFYTWNIRLHGRNIFLVRLSDTYKMENNDM